MEALSPGKNSSSKTPLRNSTFALQCRDGFAGDGEECEQDPDLDAIPVKGLSCTLHVCRKVCHSF